MSAIDKDGTIVRVSPDGNPTTQYSYWCIASDIPYLPTVDIGTGSMAIAIDTGDVYCYHADLGWVKFGGGE